MSHYYTLIKVRADTAERAVEEARAALDASVDKENNRVGWDYVGGTKLVTREVLKKSKHKSYAAMEKHWRGLVDDNLRQAKASLVRDILPHAAQRWLSAPEAARLLAYNQKRVREIAAQTVKDGTRREPPDGVEDIVGQFVEILSEMSQHPTLSPEYYLRKMQEIWRAKQEDFLIPATALQSTEVCFCNIGGDGDKIFYVLGDRHF